MATTGDFKMAIDTRPRRATAARQLDAAVHQASRVGNERSARPCLQKLAGVPMDQGIAYHVAGSASTEAGRLHLLGPEANVTEAVTAGVGGPTAGPTGAPCTS